MNNVRHWGTSATMDWTLGRDLGVKLILAHREFEAEWGRDSDASPMPINHTLDAFNDDQDTAELRVSGRVFNDKTEWTAGYFYFNAEDFNSNISVLYPCINGTACIDRIDTQTTENTGLFLNTVTSLTEKLSLTVGLRSSDDSKDILQERKDRQGVPIAGFNPPVPVHAESSETDPMVSLTYNLNDHIMFYTAYQEGFRGGGTTARPTATTRVPFGPETLANFEIGMKSDLLDRRMRLNVTLFDMDYQDMQIGTAGQDQFGQAAWVTANDGEAKIQGVEIEVNSTIGAHWFLDASYGYTDFQYVRVPTLADCLAKGFPQSSCTGLIVLDSNPGRTPENKASVNAGYMTNLSNGSEITIRYGISYQDDIFFGANDDPLLLGPAYSLHNARITWVSPDQSWEASFFGTNITDERAIQNKLNFLTLFGTVQTTYVRPEEWALTVKKRF